MEFSEAPPVPAPDVSTFVSYMTPDLQQDDDDGTDLPLPDLKSLLPETDSSSRRSRPTTPLRDTWTDTPDADEDSFGEGIEADSVPATEPDPESTVSREGQPDSSAESTTEPTGESPAKRKPRRRRRRGRRGGRKPESSADQPAQTSAGETVAPATDKSGPADDRQQHSAQSLPDSGRSGTGSQDGPDGSTDGSTEGKDGTAKPRKRRRRRRRGPRKKNSPSSGGADNASGSAGGTEA